MTRYPIVAGMFYENNPDILKSDIENIFKQTHGNDINLKESSEKRSIIAAVAPHAGYVYSGPTASFTYNAIAKDGIPETFVIIGPSHTGIGDAVTTTTENTWMTPFGEIEVDTEFKEKLIENDQYLIEDDSAHIREHSVEVEIPFIQYISSLQNKNIKIVPIVIKNQLPQLCKNLANSIKKTKDELKRDIVVIASTDLNHYEDANISRTKNQMVLNSIERMDSDELFDTVRDYDISMCGYGPTITAITLAKLEDATDSQILDYSDSGEASGDYSSVVGYGSAILKKIV